MFYKLQGYSVLLKHLGVSAENRHGGDDCPTLTSFTHARLARHFILAGTRLQSIFTQSS